MKEKEVKKVLSIDSDYEALRLAVVAAMKKYNGRGLPTRVAKLVGLTRTSVHDVLKGKWRNDKVMAAFVQVLETERKQEQMLQAKLAKLTQSV